ncbi:MAG TPA: glycosyltransferase family 4 protein [Planctomycetota bacterium]|nr:hypothetical protein [Planctomycetota bacterium]MDP7245152.1 glycosyltransferase family 4 protein [Planctomycetota bacterium]HJM39273.1 glycosyltransferase family 4 protein [Planctomycetota bacterium]
MTCNSYRILQLLPTLSQGGAELYVLRLTKLQVDGPMKPVVCSFLQGGPVEELLHKGRVPLELLNLPRNSIRNPFKALRDWRRIYKAVKKTATDHQIDLIQTHLSDSDWLGLMVGRALNIPVVLTFHSSKLIPPERDPRELRSRLRMALQSKFYRRADALIAVGTEVRNSLLKFPGVIPKKVHLIPSAIEIPPKPSLERKKEMQARFTEIRSGQSPILAAVGRLVPSKGHDRLIESMPTLLKELPDARLWIIGDGPEMENLASLIKHKGLENSVCLLGGRTDVPELLAAADIFVTGTHREGLGLATAEGMAAGLPAVGFKVTGIVDIIAHEVNGLLLEDGDLVGFAHAIVQLQENPELAKAMGIAGRKTADAFDVRHSREKTEAVYRGLLEA